MLDRRFLTCSFFLNVIFVGVVVYYQSNSRCIEYATTPRTNEPAKVSFISRTQKSWHSNPWNKKMSPEYILGREEVYRDRWTRLLNVCYKYSLGIFAKKTLKAAPSRSGIVSAPVESFFYDTIHKISWCPIYKAASTSWFTNFLVLGGANNSDVTKGWLKKTRIVWPELSVDDAQKEFLDSRVNFFIVRHPFERLVSAYRDKLKNRTGGLNHGTMFYYEAYGRKIVERFRPIQSKISQLEPTFEEFVRYLISIDIVVRADEHWRPYYVSCAPCLVKFSVIAQFETLEDDQNYILWKGRANHLIKPSWKHSTTNNSAKITKQYFSSLDKKLVRDLFEKYRPDFEMFGYTIDDYL